MKRILFLTFAVMIVLTLSACQLFAHDYKEEVLEYALIATDGSELTILDQYPNLEYVDLRGSTCYEEILDYCTAHPNIKVRFSIDLGQQPFNQDVTTVTLSGDDANFDDLKNNLKFFPSLKSVHFDQVVLTKAQLDELKNAYPQIDFTYTVKIGEEIYDSALSELNLSKISASHVDEVITSLELLPSLSSVTLSESNGESKLTLADAKRIMQAYPQLTYHYQFQLFGQMLSPQTDKLIYKDVKIGNTGLEQIRNAMAVMPNCTYVCLDNCGINNDVMDAFRAEFPDKTVVWRIFVDRFSVLSDTEVILMQRTVNDDEAAPLRYCTNVKYLDMTGCTVRNFEFLSNMPNLECAVLQQTYVSDLSVLQNAQNLTWLDLAGCTALRDLSPLSGMTNLKNLNLSATKVKDLSPLDNIPLERFKCAKVSFTPAELNSFKTTHPDCLTTDTGNMIGKGWRYDDTEQRVPCAYYAEMIKIFGYAK